MEREAIVRDDFPTVRKGWDPAAVRAHLEALADRLPSGSAALADLAAERVREILAAAEATAAEIEAEARREADDALTRAREEAERRVEQAQAAVESLVSQAEDLRSRVGSLGASVSAGSGPEPDEPDDEVAPIEAEEPSADAEEPSADDEEPKPSPVPTATDGAAEGGQDSEATEPAEAAEADTGAARLVAMNMALEGAGREEIAARLAADFAPLVGADALVDDVLARAGRD